MNEDRDWPTKKGRKKNPVVVTKQQALLFFTGECDRGLSPTCIY